ncbi:MAG: hypothetical protein M3246_09910 [Actinomycetota bacterium]|nr:hypothetical protein [Actinomycetota bacterium]
MLPSDLEAMRAFLRNHAEAYERGGTKFLGLAALEAERMRKFAELAEFLHTAPHTLAAYFVEKSGNTGTLARPEEEFDTKGNR